MLLIRNYITLKAQQITKCPTNNGPTGVEHLKRQLDNLRALFLRTKKFNKIFFNGEFADIDHLIPAQTDHRFRGKLTT
jgi:hypothetical protein